MAAVKKEKGIEPALQNTQVGYYFNDRGGFCHLSKLGSRAKASHSNPLVCRIKMVDCLF